MLLNIFSLCILLFHQTVWGIYFPVGRNSVGSPVSLKSQAIEKSYEAFFSSNESYNDSRNGTDESSREDSQIFTSENTQPSDENNSTGATVNQTPSFYSTNSDPSTSSIQSMETLTTSLNNESHSHNSTQFSTSVSSAATNQGTTLSNNSSILPSSPNNETNPISSTIDDDEPEGVARGKPSTTESVSTTTTPPQTLFQKTWQLISDTYTLSILVPVVAGIVFATTIILTIATCRCLRRRCIRRRMRRKALPDSVKNLRPSDRARLLAESSDEEF